jgi:ATP-binding cassette, subfamily C (CFTR/MRP), member 1
MISSDTTLPIVMTCSQALKVLMLVLESVEKRGLIKDGLVYSFEATSSTLSRSVFFWLVPLFKMGFRKTIALDDLYPLDERLKGAPLYNTFVEAWAKGMCSRGVMECCLSSRILFDTATDHSDILVPNQEAPGALMSTWMGAFGKSILAPIIPRLCMMAFVYAQPFLIKQAIILAQLPKAEIFDNWGYGLIGAFVIVYGGLAVRLRSLLIHTIPFADMEYL